MMMVDVVQGIYLIFRYLKDDRIETKHNLLFHNFFFQLCFKLK